MTIEKIRNNFIIVLLILFFDRFSKIFVINLNNKLLGSEIFSSKFLNISLIWNKGIAFGFFHLVDYYDSLTIVILIIILIIIFMTIKSEV